MADMSDCGVCPCCPGKTCLFLSCSLWCACSFVGRRIHFSQKKCFLTACVALRDVKTKSFSVYFLIAQNICPHATHTLCGQHDIAAREAKHENRLKTFGFTVHSCWSLCICVKTHNLFHSVYSLSLCTHTLPCDD